MLRPLVTIIVSLADGSFKSVKPEVVVRSLVRLCEACRLSSAFAPTFMLEL